MDDAPQLDAYAFLLGRAMWHNPALPVIAFGLNGITTDVVPADGMDFPFRTDRLFVYAQLFGDPGGYGLWVRLVRIERTEYDEEVEVQLGPDGEPREFPMPGTRPFEVSGLNFLDEIAFPLVRVLFAEAGVYEFQLWASGSDEPIASARVQARR